VDEPDSIQYLGETIIDALAELPPGSKQQVEAFRALRELTQRATRTDAICEVCHGAAVEEGKRLATAPSDPYLWESGT